MVVYQFIILNSELLVFCDLTSPSPLGDGWGEAVPCFPCDALSFSQNFLRNFQKCLHAYIKSLENRMVIAILALSCLHKAYMMPTLNWKVKEKRSERVEKKFQCVACKTYLCKTPWNSLENYLLSSLQTFAIKRECL